MRNARLDSLALPKKMRRGTPRRCAIIALALASITAFAAQAKADIITTYNVTGTFEDGANLSGTLTMDTTTAIATAMNVMITSPEYGSLNLVSTPTSDVFTTLHISSSYDVIKTLLEPTPNISYYVQLEEAAPGFAWPSGVIPLINDTQKDVAGDVTAYGVFDFTFGVGNLSEYSLVSGELDPVTPEPATLTLLFSGCLSFGGFRLCRKRPKAAESTPAS
jgi:hypothetical protein